ncbi:ArsR/SmtB family transcription factor [Streptomyces sp. NPDC021212]|uniref:ArsR/SmtB family transcription factor n=1 Tax=Streptomyces sp. NPDC021212 TaxID=3365118 RepID=UPI00379036CB
MYRIILSADDLTRIRISESDVPFTEALFAMEALHVTGEDGFHEWRCRIRRYLGNPAPRSARLAKLTRVVSSVAEMLDLCIDAERPHATPGIDGSTSHAQLLSAVRDFSALAVIPHRERIRVHLDCARESLRDTMSRDGVGALLDSLGPQIRWKAPVLEIVGVRPGELRLDGRGLMLAPSLFLQRPGHIARAGRSTPERPPLLAIPVRPRSEDVPDLLADTNALRGDQREDTDNLAALMGRTRAAALRAVREGCGNAALAERLGVTTAAVSQHTTVLRAAGLISTHRSGSRAVHTVTHLGRLLLQGNGVASRHVLSAIGIAGQPAPA